MTLRAGKLTLTGLLLLASACATEAPTPLPPPPPPPPAPVMILPPPPPVYPSILPSGPVAGSAENAQLERLAEHYLTFAQTAVRASESSSLASEATIANSVDRLAALVNSDLIDGARAYAVLQAARSPEFIAGVDAWGKSRGRDGFIAAITANPTWVRDIPGYDAGVRRASASLAASSRQVDAAAEVVRQASYTLQRERWTQRPANKQARLAAVRANWQQAYVATGLVLPNADPSQADRQVRDELMAAAALYIVRADAETLRMSGQGSGQFCTRSAYLNTQQCLAASRFPYELTFCIAAHQVRETMRCVSDATVLQQSVAPVSTAANPVPGTP